MGYKFYSYCDNPEILIEKLKILSEAERRQAVLENNGYGSFLLILLLKNPECIRVILTLLAKDDRLAAIQHKDRNGFTVLGRAASFPSSLKEILFFFPAEERFALAEQDQTFLSEILKEPESLKTWLELLPKEKCSEIVNEKGFLHKVLAQNPNSLRVVLSLYPTAGNLKALQEKNENGRPVLHQVAINSNIVLEHLLSLLPKEDLHIAIREEDMEKKTVLEHVFRDKKLFSSILTDFYTENERYDSVRKFLPYAKADDLLMTMLTLLQPEQCALAIEVKDSNGGNVLQQVSIKSSINILGMLPQDKRLNAMQQKNNEGRTLLHIIAQCNAFLTPIMTLLPPNERLLVVQEKDNEGNSVLHNLPNYYESMITLLSLLTPEQCAVAILEQNGKGQTLLHLIAGKPSLLRDVLTRLPADRLLTVIQETELLHEVASNDESLSVLLELLHTQDLTESLKQKNHKNDETVLHLATKNNDCLNRLLALYSKPALAAVLKEKDKEGQTIVHRAAMAGHESLTTVLDLYPNNDERLTAIQERDINKQTALMLAPPSAIVSLLTLYPKDERFTAIVEKGIDGNSPWLKAASSHNYLDLLTLLPEDERIAILKEKNKSGITLLELERGKDKLNAIFSLLPKNALLTILQTKNSQGIKVIHQPAIYNQPKTTLLLLPEKNRLEALMTRDGLGRSILSRMSETPDFIDACFSCFSPLNQNGSGNISQQLQSLFFTKDSLLAFSNVEEKIPLSLIALNIFYTLEQKRPLLAESEDMLPAATNYSGDAALVQKAEERYTQAKTHFAKEFSAEPYCNTIRNVELLLKKDILRRRRALETDLGNNGNQDLISLLSDSNIELLAAGNNEELNEQARTLLTSNDDVYSIAWRAYDRAPPDKDKDKAKGWENLFVIPHDNLYVHSGTFSTLDLESAVYNVRHRAAIFYLAAIDPRYGADQDSRVDALINNIAECRRAHNLTKTGVDNPSCYPGTITRLSYSLTLHPLFHEPENLEEKIYLKIKALAEAVLSDVFTEEDRSKKDKELMYLSTLMLGIRECKEVLTDTMPSQKITSLLGSSYDKTKLLKFRAEFLSRMEQHKVFDKVKSYLIEQNIITHHSSPLWIKADFYMFKALLNLGGMSLGLTTEQQKVLGYLPTTEEGYVDENDSTPYPMPSRRLYENKLFNANKVDYEIDLAKHLLYEFFKRQNVGKESSKSLVLLIVKGKITNLDALLAKLRISPQTVLEDFREDNLGENLVTEELITRALQEALEMLPSSPESESGHRQFNF